MGLKHSKADNPLHPLEILERDRRNLVKRQKNKKKRYKEIQEAISKGAKIPKLPDDRAQTAVIKKSELTLSDYEEYALSRLRQQSVNDFSSFLLNQLTMSIQFFGNYERDKNEAIDRNLSQEKEKNSKLVKHLAMLPNVLDDAVDQRIKFQMKHGPRRHIQEPLHKKTIYLVHENVEILKPEETNYEVISPTCKVIIETEYNERESYKGYVRLKLWEMLKQGDIARNERRKRRNKELMRRIRKGKTATSSSSSLADEDDDTDNDDHAKNDIDDGEEPVQEVIYNSPRISKKDNEDYEEFMKNGCNSEMARNSTSTSTNPSTSEYDYAYISNLNSHHPLSQLTTVNYLSPEINQTAIPAFCITGVPPSSDITKKDDTDSEDSDDSSDEEIIEIKYLNSKIFLCYFANLFKEKLAGDLGISNTDVDVATWRGASIFSSNLEIIPAIYCPWPNCAFGFRLRKRPVHENPINGQKLVWPDQVMINRVISFGCHVIPLGYAPKTGKNPNRELEWKIVFPKAERFLETCLTSTQAKIFMISKALIKTFVEPQQDKDTFMFTLDHLRTHLFWECEKNYGAFPEEYLGEVLIRFLKSFLEKLSIRTLHDFFLPKRNLFECIPERSKIELHEIISQIVYNPVMHIMMAYRNLQQFEKFCPKINIRRLYNALVIDNPLQLIEKIPTNIKKSKIAEKIRELDKQNEDINPEEKDSEDETEKQKGAIGLAQKKEKFDATKQIRTQRFKRKKQEKLIRKRQQEIAARPSMDSIDLQFAIPQTLEKIKRSGQPKFRAVLDDIRRSCILEVFTNFFIQMSKNTLEFKSFDLAITYLKQADRLCALLDDYGQNELANKIRNQVKNITMIAQNSKQTETESGPALPKRSMEPVRKTFRNQSIEKSVERKLNTYLNTNSSPVKQRSLKNHSDCEKENEKKSKSVVATAAAAAATAASSSSPSSRQQVHKTQRQPSNPRKSVRITGRKSVQFMHTTTTVTAQINSPSTRAPPCGGRAKMGIMKQTSVEEKKPDFDNRSSKSPTSPGVPIVIFDDSPKISMPPMPLQITNDNNNLINGHTLLSPHEDEGEYGDSTEL